MTKIEFIAFVAAYLVVGFIAAIIARQSWEYGTCVGLKYILPTPLTWGHALLCALAAIVAPLCVIAAIVWGICWALTSAHSGKSFLAQPIFKPARKDH